MSNQLKFFFNHKSLSTEHRDIETVVPVVGLWAVPFSASPQQIKSLLTICPPQHWWLKLSWSDPSQQIWFPDVEYGVPWQQESPIPTETQFCSSFGQQTSPADWNIAWEFCSGRTPSFTYCSPSGSSNCCPKHWDTPLTHQYLSSGFLQRKGLCYFCNICFIYVSIEQYP